MPEVGLAITVSQVSQLRFREGCQKYFNGLLVFAIALIFNESPNLIIVSSGKVTVKIGG